MFFTQIYIYDNNKNIYMLIYKKSLKKCLRLFHKTFSNCQNNQAIFHRVSIEIGLTPPLQLFVFIHSLRTPPPPPQQTQGFPHVLRTQEGGSSKFHGDGLSQYMGGAWGRLKILLKNTCDRVHLIVKLPAISLQASTQIY